MPRAVVAMRDISFVTLRPGYSVGHPSAGIDCARAAALIPRAGSGLR